MITTGAVEDTNIGIDRPLDLSEQWDETGFLLRMIPAETNIGCFWEHIHRYRFALGFAEGRHVLDAACGEGYGSAALMTRAQSVLGIDRDPSAVDWARRRYSVDARVGDVQAMPFAYGAFDLVTSFETFEQLPKPEAFLSEVHRVLVDGGTFVLSTPNAETFPKGAKFHHREYLRHEVVALLRAAGFTKIRRFTQCPVHTTPFCLRALAVRDDATGLRKLPGFHALKRLARFTIYDTLQDNPVPTRFRRYPVEAICTRSPSLASLINNYVVRRYNPFLSETALFNLFVSTK